MTRSSESRAQRASRRGTSNAPSGSSKSDSGSRNNNEGEREQVARQEERGRPRSRRRSSGKYKQEETAAVDRAPNQGRGAEESEANEVLGAFYNMLQQGAPPQGGGKREEGSIHIDLRKASNVLEAAAGNMALAANLYWDDYFATQAANQFEAAADPPSEWNARNPVFNPNDDQKPAAEAVARGGDNRSFPFEQHEEGGVGGNDHYDERMVENRRHSSSRSSQDSKRRLIHLAADYPSPSKRRLRRSLDSDFQAADDDDETKKKKRAAKRARKSNESIDKSMAANNGDANEDDHKMPAIRRDGIQEDVDVERESRPQPRRRMNRSYASRHQEIVQGDDDVNNNREAEGNSDGSDENEQEDGSKHKEPVRRHRPRRQKRRGEPRRIAAQVGLETSISVSDDELGRAGYYKDSKGGKSSYRRIGDRDLNRGPSRKMKNDPSNVVSRSAVLKAVKAIHRKINPDTTNLSKPSTWFLSPEQKRKKRARDDDDDDDNNDDDDDSVDSNDEGSIDDEDWLTHETYHFPEQNVWGPAGQIELPPPVPLAGEDNTRNEVSNGNVVADDDAMNVSGEEEDGYDNNAPSVRSTAEGVQLFGGIPHTWLNAGFQLSECGSGLVIKSPRVEDIEFFSWRQQQVNDKRNAIPPPHHCKALTAITSIVTGLLYTGASIQGDEVNFTSGKIPWSSLTVDERRREFESRLSDALSSLIFIAAQVSLKRKKKAYRKAIRMNKPANVDKMYSDLLREAIAERKITLAAVGNDDNKNADDESSGKENDLPSGHVIDSMGNRHIFCPSPEQTKEQWPAKKELMRRRLDLIPTCSWMDKKVALAPRAGDGPLFNLNAKVKMSWTNIRDIELYVKSNLRAFTEKGGIALFLETLVRIHGTGFIEKEFNRRAAVTAAGSVGEEKIKNGVPGVSQIENAEESLCKTKASVGFRSLIRCTCEDRQKKIHEDNPLPLNVRIDPNKLLDTTPSGAECVSVEFLSFILTGRLRSDLRDFSSEKLGIGLLTENIGEVSHGLARPKQPVWLLRGETCYSVLTVDGSWSSGCNEGGPRSVSVKGSSRGNDLKTISKVDKPGASLNLCHWNGWYGQRRKTGMRLVASKPSEEVPSKKLLAQFSEQHGSINMKSLVMRRRRQENIVNAISVEEHKSIESKEKEIAILPSELERIKIHLEDQKLYPRNHKLWRFDMGDANVSISPAMDRKPPAENWIPYFKLTSRQKRKVETKLGPKINTILWTRWPGAVVDNFTPSEGGFAVV